jgi:hypothetical protein
MMNLPADSKRKLATSLAMAGLVVLMLLLACTPGISLTEDLGRHLLLGRIILENHAVPHANLLTYTFPDYPFINHHWLSEVVFYVLHKGIGLNGLIGFKMLLMATTLWLALRTVRTRRREAPTSGEKEPADFRSLEPSPQLWFAGLLAAILLGYCAHIRPELLSFLGVALYGWLFERMRAGARWPRWALIPIAMLWANLHIYFMFGLFMAGCFSFERCWHDRRAAVLLREGAWLLALLLASSINPNGIRGLLYPLGIFADYGMAITENASPLEYARSVVNPMLLALPALLLATGVALSQRAARERIWNVLMVAAAGLMAVGMARNVPLFALVALPVIASGGPKLQVSGGKIKETMTHLVLLALLVLNLGLCIAVVDGSYSRIFPSPIAPTPFGFDDEARYAALRDLQRDGLRGPVFNDYNVGSLVEYTLYPEPGYVDNRPEAFPAAFWRTEYLPALALGADWNRIVERRDINAIIVSWTGVKEAYCQALMQNHEWALVHADGFLGVWVRNRAQNAALIEKRGWTPEKMEAYRKSIAERLAGLDQKSLWRRQVEADRVVYETYSLLCMGDPTGAWPLIQQMHRLYPDYQIVHELMRVTAPPEAVEEVKLVLAQRARWPVASKQVLDWGRVLETDGQVNEADKVYRRGLKFFPLSDSLRGALTRLQDLQFRERQGL